jgi:hypothetical protein
MQICFMIRIAGHTVSDFKRYEIMIQPYSSQQSLKNNMKEVQKNTLTDYEKDFIYIQLQQK